MATDPGTVSARSILPSLLKSPAAVRNGLPPSIPMFRTGSNVGEMQPMQFSIETVKLPDAVFPTPSVAEQFTVVCPMGNKVPDAGAHDTANRPDTTSIAVAE